MTRCLLALALATACTGAFARDLHCEVHGDYAVAVDDGAVRFEREDGAPATVEFRDDRLWIDGHEATLGEADRERVRRYADEARRLAPEARALALDAVDVAFTAIAEVARGLSDSPEDSLQRLAEARKRVERSLDAPAPIGDAAAGALVEDVVAELVPALVGDVVQGAVWAALTGNTARIEALEARAERMEREIERQVEPRARELGLRAEALCERVARLDAIEAELDYRLPGGEPLDLLRSGPE